MLAGMFYPGEQGEIGLLLHSGGKEECAWDTEDPFRPLLVLLCPTIKVSGKMQHSNSISTTNGPVPSVMKVWVIPLGKEPQLSEGLLKAKVIQNRYWEKIIINTNYEQVTSYRNENCNSHVYFLILLILL